MKMKLSKDCLLAFHKLSKIEPKTLTKFFQKLPNLPSQAMANQVMVLVTFFDSGELFLKKLLGFCNISPLLPLKKYASLYSQDIGFELLLVSDEVSFRNQSPSYNRKKLKTGQRGLTLSEGLWLSLEYPNLLSTHSIDLIGSKYSIECVPTLYKWREKKFLSAICPDVQDPMCGSPIVLAKATLSRKDLTNPDIFVSKAQTLYATYLK